MINKKPSTLRARSRAAEAAIIEATLRILAEGGYSALTIDRVAATARASKTTIYRRWRTKEHLVLAAFADLPIAQPVLGSGLEADLVGLFRQFVGTMEGSPLRGVLPKLTAECINNPQLSTALIQINELRRAPIRQVLAHAIREGELRSDTDVELAIDMIQGAIAIRLYFLLDQIDEGWLRGLVQMLLRGTAQTKPVRRPSRSD